MNVIQFLLNIMIIVVVVAGLIVVLDDYSTYWDLQRRLKKEKERRD